MKHRFFLLPFLPSRCSWLAKCDGVLPFLNTRSYTAHRARTFLLFYLCTSMLLPSNGDSMLDSFEDMESVFLWLLAPRTHCAWMPGAAQGAAVGNQSLLDMIPACSACWLRMAELQHIWSTAGSCQSGFCLGLQLCLISPQPLSICAGSSILVIPPSSSQRCQLSAPYRAFPWPPAPAPVRFLPTECLQVTQWPKHSQAAP